ncbi:sulfatase-like hydrolase/transferase [Pseudokordiimonas caeni]|uniref:sulfatase-like hydrolase/transferase n=1 Tax=Pseudokordiimonas caeni TaxID=2997908 RepID=UPI0028113A46|nr:sulfatase-like hydrolase/transferase [Pseudokordiimonas caeni]
MNEQATASDSRRPVGNFIYILACLVICNLPFVGFYIIGTDSRMNYIALYTVLGILAARRINPWLVATLWSALVLDLLSTGARVFSFTLLELAGALKFLPMLAPSEGIAFYLPFLAIILSGVLLTFAAYRYRPLNPDRLAVPFTMITFTLAGGEYFSLQSIHYDLGKTLGPSEEFQSASLDTGFEQRAITLPDNGKVLMVMVESYGEYKDVAIRDIVSAPLFSETISSRFNIQTGSTTFLGHTTDAEMRELCGTWEKYSDLEDVERPSFGTCMPHRLLEAGVETVAIHNFRGRMFDRRDWYPKIGITRASFYENMYKLGMAECRGVFLGPCDPDVLDKVVAPELTSDGKRFVYFLTLTGHLPFVATEADTPFACGAKGAAISDYQACQQANYIHHFLDRLAETVARADEDLTTILIVGDHEPPFMKRDAKQLFNPKIVPWFYLTRKGPDVAQGAPETPSETGAGR